MARLLEFEEDGLPTLIKKSTLLGQQKEVEIFEKALGENVGDLPLGKALHLLLHVHSHVFDNAVNILQQSDLLELTLRKNDSPAVRALLSLDNYVKSSEQDRLTNFKHIYDSVKEKFLKKSKSNTNQSSMRIIGYFLLNSQYKDDINTFMCNELRKNDKRNQLAAVLLIDFIFFTYIASSTENHWNLISLVAPELIRIAHQSNQPTLLCTTSCELALKCAHYLLINLKKPILSPSRMVNDASKLKIIEIDPVLNTSEKIHHLNGIWRGVDTLLCLMEKWSTPNTHLTHSAFSELHSLFQNDVGIFDNENFRQSILISSEVITKYLTPKHIISDKGLSNRKIRELVSFKTNETSSPLVAFIKITILTLLQNGHWNRLYGLDRSAVILNAEEEELKLMVINTMADTIKAYPILNGLGKRLIPKLIITLPYLFKEVNINSTKVIQLILDLDWLEVDNMDQYEELFHILVPILSKEIDTSIDSLLIYLLYEDEKTQFSYGLLKSIVTSKPDLSVSILKNKLLLIVKDSNRACELLIDCIPYLNLPSLILDLMPRVQNEVHRHQMIYLALISKVLLYEEWSADSILIYIDMVRDFRDLRGFMKMNDSIADANKLDPTSITSVKYYIKETPFEGLDIDSFCMTLLTPLELWSRKVDTKSMEYALNQLIRKSCGSPNDGLFISAWQRLSFVYMDHHELIWCTLGECVHIMISQLKITENDLHDMTRLKHIIFVRLIPMLILQTIPKEYFKEVQVPRQYIALLKSRLVGLEVDPGLIRTSDKSKHSEVCIRLMDELINRCMNPYESHDIAKFAKSLLTKIFYRQ